MKVIIKEILFYFWSLLRSKKKQQQVFLMGHPRSGSSLVMHLLTTNNEILGFGEYLTKYYNSRTLLKAEFDIRRKTHQLFSSYGYIANQINHHSITPNKELLIDENIKVIFLIREPEASLSSWKIFSEKKGKPMSIETISEFYIERLEYLGQLANHLPAENWCYLKYEDLIENPEISLEKLSRFLKLSDPLKSNYRLQGFTQVWGDSSENITKGEIFKTSSKQFSIDKKIVHITNEAYQKTLNQFIKNSSQTN